MKKELNIVTYIKKHGLAKAINEFKLICKTYDHKILLKYSQIESPMNKIEVQECRGLILEKDTWKVMNMTFSKFFNAEETHAAKIDWESAHVLFKLDGSLVQLYFDWHKNEWCVATSGMAEAEGEVNDKPGTNFAKLFWDTLYKVNPNFKLEKLNVGFSYAFELTTPYNIVVTPHGTSSITLLGIRNLDTLKEISYDGLTLYGTVVGLPVVKRFDMNVSDVGAIKKTFEGMPFSEEGYVVVDKYFNRIKIKNPAYVTAHMLKNKTSHHHIMGVIKSNEVGEYIATFPEREDEINGLKKGYDELVQTLDLTWEKVKTFRPKNITKEEQKKFAIRLFEELDKVNLKSFSGLFFGLKDYKVESVKNYMMEYDNKRLYQLFTKDTKK